MALRAGQLTTTLSIRNVDEMEITFTAALHSYLRVADIADATVEGLLGHAYIDSARGGTHAIQQEQLLGFSGETDRIYPCSHQPLVLRDAHDVMTVHSQGFLDTVVWNPGRQLAAQTPDLGAGNHIAFVCIEAACLAPPIRLAPGQVWSGAQMMTIAAQASETAVSGLMRSGHPLR